jgi:hypothetical protein
MNPSEPLPQDVQQAIDQLAEHRTVTIPENTQIVIGIAKAVQAADFYVFRDGGNDVFRAAVQAVFGPMNW